MVSSVLDFIFPKTSVITDKRLDENNSNQYVSDDEINSIPRVTLSDLVDLKNKIISDYTFSLFTFREGDDFSKIIYELKYGGMKRLGIYLGNMLGHEVELYLKEKKLLDFDYIIPVPLFKTKFRERGYNQSDFICKGMNEILKLNFVTDIVKRVRHTSTQTKLNREERIKNMKDAFEINKKYKNLIYGKRIILVDDVVTTGSTMNEVIKVLKENECLEISACTLAMAR
ncbi:MAG: ComF family protein [Bacteroidota bacterium]|nr:ComF family protein [Bacteroidota bacterium]